MDARRKFIVLEGTDGSGKTAQFERLVLAFPENVKLGTLDFPRYGEPSSYFVEKYLTGKYGGEVGPYAVSTFFALDRFDAKLKMLQWFEEGRIVLANRYIASNMAYQGAKMEKKSERETFYKWLYRLEYEEFGIPKPDANIILHVPAEIANKFIAKKSPRTYLNGATGEIYEVDLAHRKHAEEIYLEIAALFPDDFTIIECAPDGTLLSPEEIHEKVREVAGKMLKSKF